MRTQVGIIGAGPTGLLLSHLLHLGGVDSVVLERRTRAHCETRVRAGVLEHGAIAILREAGVTERLEREGLVHRGVNLQFAGARQRIDFVELVGHGITVYGQQEVVKDLIAARIAGGGTVLFDVQAVGIDGIDGEQPSITFMRGSSDDRLECDVVAACDGSFGIGRQAMPAGSFTRYDRVFPHAWLGVLARTPPASEELVYAYHEHGFALQSMRTPQISRLYLQVGIDERLEDWPEERIWEELRIRLAEPRLRSGEILEIGITPMRSTVIEPMQHGRLYLAGDAAHIVPPTGAKGMNLGLADASTLARALVAWWRGRSTAELDAYTATCLRRVWRAQHFSASMTSMLHLDPHHDPFEHRLRLARLDEIVSSRAAATLFAESYTSAATGRAEAVALRS